MFTKKKLKLFSLLIFCLFFMAVAWAGSQLDSINYEPATCTDDSETEEYEETEEGDYDESYDENSPEEGEAEIEETE